MRNFGTHFRLVFIFTVVVFLTVQIGEAAGPLASPTFSITFVANIHDVESYGVNFGIHPSATIGIDPALGEIEYPPFGPSPKLMFSNVVGNSILDLRPYTSPSQIDTYKVGFTPFSDTYPITFSWPNLNLYYSGSVRLKSDLNGSLFDIDMKTQTSYTMATGPFNPPDGPPIWFQVYVYIIAEGPLPVNLLQLVSTYGLGNGGFQAIVHAPAVGPASLNSVNTTAAGTTNVWFEYGPTKSYGTSTTPQSVPDGSHLNVSAPFDTSSMPPNTRYHFRAVAQNNLGTFYGGDRIVSRGNPPAEVSTDTTKYRTATYRDWADAKDYKGKQKSIKGKPIVFQFDFRPVICQSNESHDLTALRIEFSAEVDTFGQKLVVLTDNHPGRIIAVGGVATTNDPKLKKWKITFDSLMNFGDAASIRGFAWTTKPKLNMSYYWLRGDTIMACGKRKDFQTGTFLGLPMPNLHNVGEGIFGGVSQTPVVITVGSTNDAKGAHTVYHPKYGDVLKSLGKRGMYHTVAPHPLDTFDKNGAVIKKKQKSLPPDKHNNRLFAEQLTLKLNVAASDSGIFPPGLGDLIFDNSGVIGIGGPFDGLTIRKIADSVDKYLGCNGDVAGTEDSSYFLKVDSLINVAFAGPMDTTSWSGGKVFCTGVRMLKDVPYLHSNPSAVPRIDFSRGPGASYTEQPLAFALSQNYPNPFNPTTTIDFVLSEPSIVTLKVYNLLGQEVQILLNNEMKDEGDQSIEFDASNLPSGVYFYKITAQGESKQQFQAIKRMLLLK